jgi:hypothetical protein
MCNQTVSLIAAAIESRNISTVVLQLLREPAERVRPPRALLVPFRHGYPLDAPGNPQRQLAVIEAGLRLLENSALAPPVLTEF